MIMGDVKIGDYTFVQHDIRKIEPDEMKRFRKLDLSDESLMDKSGKVPPHWEMFVGNNHNFLVNHRSYFMGGVRFGSHIGKMLSDRLWVDLVYRCQIDRLRIYRHGESRWCDGLGPGACVINLDDDAIVRASRYSRDTLAASLMDMFLFSGR